VKTPYQGTPISHTHFVTFIMSVVIEEEDMNTRKQEAALFGGLKREDVADKQKCRNTQKSWEDWGSCLDTLPVERCVRLDYTWPHPPTLELLKLFEDTCSHMPCPRSKGPEHRQEAKVRRSADPAGGIPSTAKGCR